MLELDIVSRHLFRRRARVRMKALNNAISFTSVDYHYTVRKADRGPFRWYCVKVRR